MAITLQALSEAHIPTILEACADWPEPMAPTVAPWGEIWTGFSTGAESVTVSAGPTGSSGRTDTSEQ